LTFGFKKCSTAGSGDGWPGSGIDALEKQYLQVICLQLDDHLLLHMQQKVA
jgi:hypothetical protein